MKNSCLLFVLALGFITNAQKLTGTQLLEKSIAFHDPENNWRSFMGDLKIIMETPNSGKRASLIHMDLPKEIFDLNVAKGNDTYAFHLEKDSCKISLNGKSEITDTEAKKLRLSCERANMMKNYYTYLYGLPMKLKDPGTLIDPKVQTKKFKGKEYLVLKTTYTQDVGKDIWYFYFDPTTYAMEVYQFYHDEAKNDGEYILLSGTAEVNGIKMPKTRAWYYNKDNKYLGTDILNPSLASE